jgi:hypothetical protein
MKEREITALEEAGYHFGMGPSLNKRSTVPEREAEAQQAGAAARISVRATGIPGRCGAGAVTSEGIVPAIPCIREKANPSKLRHLVAKEAVRWRSNSNSHYLRWDEAKKERRTGRQRCWWTR